MTYEEQEKIQKRDLQEMFEQDVKRAAELFNALEVAIANGETEMAVYNLKDFLSYKIDCLHLTFCNAITIIDEQERLTRAAEQALDDERRQMEMDSE